LASNTATPRRRARTASAPETHWLEVSVEAEREAVESLSEAFSRWGNGVAVHEPIHSSPDGEIVTLDPSLPVRVVTHLAIAADTEQRRAEIENAVGHLAQLRSIGELHVETVSDKTWEEAWKRYFTVHRIGKRVVIVPSWRRYRAEPDDIVIRLDPGMAFGTGLHPTTRLCTLALETRVEGEELMLDLGCGSGILSIVAAKLGARRIVGVDIEPIAVDVARENIRRNKVVRAIDVLAGDLEAAAEQGPFDAVMANISFRVLSGLPERLFELVRPGGYAILSGVLDERREDLVALWTAAGWQSSLVEVEGDWLAAQFERP
jgi:ribosomal protein L11 methyltransferase